MSAQGGDYGFNMSYYHRMVLAGLVLGCGFRNRWHIVNSSQAVFYTS